MNSDTTKDMQKSSSIWTLTKLILQLEIAKLAADLSVCKLKEMNSNSAVSKNQPLNLLFHSGLSAGLIVMVLHLRLFVQILPQNTARQRPCKTGKSKICMEVSCA